jgi:hypothetical protein
MIDLDYELLILTPFAAPECRGTAAPPTSAFGAWSFPLAI